MSRFQKRALVRSIIIGLLWVYFAQYYLQLGVGTTSLGFLTILFLGLRIGRRQEGMGSIALVFGILTFISFIFGLIPVYTAKPNLDGFYATKFPRLYCIQNNLPASITIGENIYSTSTKPSLQDICTQNIPIYAGQHISWSSSGAIIIDLGTTSNIYIQGPTNGSLEKNATGYTFSTNGALRYFYTLHTSQQIYDPLQLSLANTYIQQEKQYLQQHFPRVREFSPRMSKIAIRKMKILGLFNREFNEYVKNLEFYLSKTTN